MMKKIYLAQALVLLVLVSAAVSFAELPPPPPSASISASPASLDFGSLATNDPAVTKSVTVTNQSVNLPVFVNASVAGGAVSEFVVQNDGCTGTELLPSVTCSIDMVFSPGGHGIKNATLVITADDAQQATTSVQLTGTSNNPPLPGQLVYPASGATSVAGTFSFIWKDGSDPDGDTLSYKLYFGTDPSLAGSTEVTIIAASGAASGDNRGAVYAWGYSGGMLLLGLAFAGVGSRRRAALLIAVIILSAIVFSCAPGTEVSVKTPGGEDPGSTTAPPVPGAGERGHQATGLLAGTTYYWKVVTTDSLGGVAEGPLWSFTTK